MSSLIVARNISKTFRKGPKEIEVLRDVDFSMEKGSSVAVVGSSGEGKTTLLNILGALDHPTHGEVIFDGNPIPQMEDHEISRFRNEVIGFIFQFHYLLPEFNSIENVAMPLLIRKGQSRSSALEKARAVLDQVGLIDRFDHRPTELSGGEQQRVAIARALVTEPKLILADEPTGNLDTETAEGVSDLLFSLMAKKECGLVLVTHNMDLAGQADRILRLHKGSLKEERAAA